MRRTDTVAQLAKSRRFAEHACANLARLSVQTRDVPLMEAAVAAEAAVKLVLERIAQLELEVDQSATEHIQ
jgi:hypothetical protein